MTLRIPKPGWLLLFAVLLLLFSAGARVATPYYRVQQLCAAVQRFEGRIVVLSVAPPWLLDWGGRCHCQSLLKVFEQRVVTVDVGDVAYAGDEFLRQVAFFPEIEELDLAGTAVTDEGLSRLSKFTHLRRLDLSRTSLRGPGLTWLRSAKYIQAVDFYGCPLEGKSLEFFTDALALDQLDLTGTGVTDTDLRHLARCTALSSLSLSRTAVTGEGFAGLAALSKLERLNLSGSAVTDDGLVPLARFENLAALSLSNTTVSVAGIDRFGDFRNENPATCSLYLANTATTLARLLELQSPSNTCSFEMAPQPEWEVDEDFVAEMPMSFGCFSF